MLLYYCLFLYLQILSLQKLIKKLNYVTRPLPPTTNLSQILLHVVKE